MMKSLQLLLIFGLLCKTINAVEDVSYSALKLFQDYKHPCSSEEDPWREGVDEFYNGCRTAANSFRGKAFEIADETLNSLQHLIQTLADYTDVNATIVSTSSTEILESLSKCNHLGESGLNIITEYVKVFPTLVREFNRTANKLRKYIGKLTSSFTCAVSDLGATLTKYMREFLLNYRLIKGKKDVDYTNVLQKYQDLTNMVSVIDDTILNEEDVSKDVYDSVLVLHLQYIYMGISVTGIHSCALDAEDKRDSDVPGNVKSCVLSFKYALVELLQAVSAIIVSSVDSIRNFLNVVVNVVALVSRVVEDVLGLTSNVILTVGDTVRGLLNGNKGSGGILNGILGK